MGRGIYVAITTFGYLVYFLFFLFPVSCVLAPLFIIRGIAAIVCVLGALIGATGGALAYGSHWLFWKLMRKLEPYIKGPWELP